jgi:hypothetical protein
MDSNSPHGHGRPVRKAIFARAELSRFRVLGTARLAKLYRVAARHYNADPDTAVRNATAEVKETYGSVLSAILLKLAISFIMVLIERWLDSRLSKAPANIEYDDDDQADDDSPSPDTGFQWGNPPRSIKGAYTRSPYGGFGTFGPREAGSTFATAMMLQPVMLATSYTIEQYAEQIDPAASGLVVFGGSYLLQMFMTITLKVVSCLFRNFGASVARDIGAWFWHHFIASVGLTCWDFFTGWLPSKRRKRRRRPDGDDDNEPTPSPDDKRRPRPIIDWLFPRKRRRR